MLKDTNSLDASHFQLNTGTVGVYRVQYTPEMLQSLIPAVNDKTLPPRDRLGLENDLFALVGILIRQIFLIITHIFWGIFIKLHD